MFILEDSQLLEDTIKDPSVLQLYNKLRKSESSNNRENLIIEILASEKCQELIKILLDLYNEKQILFQKPEETGKISIQQRESLCERLLLDKTEVMPLALVVSASLLHLFIIDNFTGPTREETLQIYDEKLPPVFQSMRTKIDYTALAKDGSEVYHRVINPWLLRVAQLLWSVMNSMGCSRQLLDLEFLVWRHRCLTVHFMILLEPGETLMTDLRKVQEAIFDHHIINDARSNQTQLTRFNVVELCCELIQSALLRDGITAARKIFDYASEFSGISIEHTGVLGKRTKFQQKNVPQLVVKAKKSDEASEAIREDEGDLPKDVQLEDDTLLPDISFVSSGDVTIICDDENLSIESQLLMLAKLDYILKTEVMEESLKDEWTLSYLRSIIKSSSIWTSKYKAMAIRSLVERKNMRKMDRSLLQMEELIKVFRKDDEVSDKRLKSFYAVLPISSWHMQKTLGDLSLDLALFKNALDVYLDIEYWEGIIKCYCALAQTVKAEKIIRQELEKHETPYLYCLLGDATENIEHYEKSWSLSNGRFARAKKSLGTYYYTRKQYDEAITHYELAHKSNPSNLSILFMLAYSCLTSERYDKAAEYYRHITNLDDTNFLAWNNLSKAYIKLDQKERAWRTLREAIKCNYEEWKIWENFMVVSIDIGALDDVLTAWHRILDIKSSHKDDQILSRLTFALIRRPKSKADDEYMKLLHDSLKLVARLNSTSGCSSRHWICYFKLLIKELELIKSDNDKAIATSDLDQRVSKITNALQRATPSYSTLDSSWTQVPEKVDRLLDCYDELTDCYSYALDLLGPRPDLWRQWKNFKLSASNVIKTLTKLGYDRTSQH